MRRSTLPWSATAGSKSQTRGQKREKCRYQGWPAREKGECLSPLAATVAAAWDRRERRRLETTH